MRLSLKLLLGSPPLVDGLITVSIRHRVLDRSAVQWTFRNIMRTIKLDHAPGGRRPRINDMRHTFATKVLEKNPE